MELQRQGRHLAVLKESMDFAMRDVQRSGSKCSEILVKGSGIDAKMVVDKTMRFPPPTMTSVVIVLCCLRRVEQSNIL